MQWWTRAQHPSWPVICPSAPGEFTVWLLANGRRVWLCILYVAVHTVCVPHGFASSHAAAVLLTLTPDHSASSPALVLETTANNLTPSDGITWPLAGRSTHWLCSPAQAICSSPPPPTAPSQSLTPAVSSLPVTAAPAAARPVSVVAAPGPSRSQCASIPRAARGRCGRRIAAAAFSASPLTTR